MVLSHIQDLPLGAEVAAVGKVCLCVAPWWGCQLRKHTADARVLLSDTEILTDAKWALGRKEQREGHKFRLKQRAVTSVFLLFPYVEWASPPRRHLLEHAVPLKLSSKAPFARSGCSCVSEVLPTPLPPSICSHGVPAATHTPSILDASFVMVCCQIMGFKDSLWFLQLSRSH